MGPQAPVILAHGGFGSAEQQLRGTAWYVLVQGKPALDAEGRGLDARRVRRSRRASCIYTTANGLTALPVPPMTRNGAIMNRNS